ncbi:hypothetical protein [Variovorax jilinensis]|uniref:hypothetical protein n=1 Tax=Variovorax jilinensis TaxID=3053513 RepID=UPI0025783D32|nr:hypothetical protein [Variovorax sp. J22P168]
MVMILKMGELSMSILVRFRPHDAAGVGTSVFATDGGAMTHPAWRPGIPISSRR